MMVRMPRWSSKTSSYFENLPFDAVVPSSMQSLCRTIDGSHSMIVAYQAIAFRTLLEMNSPVWDGI
jgi:hypothetical protein